MAQYKRPGNRISVVGALLLLFCTHCSGDVQDSGGGGDGDGDGDVRPMGDGDGSGDGDNPGDGDPGDGDDAGIGGAPDVTGSGGQPTIVLGTGGNLVEDDSLIGQVDLLFVIDNSVSMADKQEMLRQAVPEMVRQMVDPPCVDDMGVEAPKEGGTCPEGSELDYAPIEDIHVGVISSSLGGHGSRSCPRADESWNNDDQGRLIPSVRPGVSSGPDGFLAWNGGDQTIADQFIQDFRSQIAAVGENGCGYEAPLEAWYRFLVDPQPPQELVLNSTQQTVMATDAQGAPLIDQVVLAQREAFLRPESLVSIIVLTDENDCSAMDGGSYYNNSGFGYLVTEASFDMPISTEECDENPNDACCLSCLQERSPPEGCESAVAVCSTVDDDRIPPEQDRANVRCFENKRRFGVDLLYPTERYVKALRDREIIDARSGEAVYNPLLTGVGAHAGTVRPHGRVYFTGIVGVPWQDLVTPASLEDPDVFEYLNAAQLAQDFDYEGQVVNRWDVMIGRRGLAESSTICQDAPSTEGCGEVPVPPLDPFMIESVEERPEGAVNPISGDAIVPSTSTNPMANNINGHEVNHLVIDEVKYTDGLEARDDLQYACIYELQTPRMDCTADDLSCECGDEPLRNRPLCQPPAGGPATNNQYYARAYPGIRILEVLRDYGDNSIVGSICPKVPEQGYTPTITTIIKRMKERFPVVR